MSARAVIVMGPSGTGKTTVGEGLSRRLFWPYVESDTFHPSRNIAKMSAGEPLTDADRQPWLEAIRDHVAERLAADISVIAACSALKRAYRDTLRGAGEVVFLSLIADIDVIARRMEGRAGHFMPKSLLQSQFDTLEPLQPDEAGATVSVEQPPDDVLTEAIERLGLTPARP